MSAFSQDDLQVAEYVLGTLDAPERDALTARLREEPALRAQRDAWERRLAPLQGLVAPQAPPAALWRRILQRIDTPRPRRGGLWGIPGLAGALASAVLLLATGCGRSRRRKPRANGTTSRWPSATRRCGRRAGPRRSPSTCTSRRWRPPAPMPNTTTSCG